MAANTDAILAGLAGSGTGNAVSWWGALGSTMPTTASMSLDAAFQDGGWIDHDSGLSVQRQLSTTPIKGMGSTTALRILTTDVQTSFVMTFLETNETSIEVFNQLEIGSLTIASDGSFDYTEGQVRTTRYAAVFDVIDGDNRVRACCPNVGVTGQGNTDYKPTDAIKYPLTVTAYPGSDGTAIHWFILATALAS